MNFCRAPECEKHWSSQTPGGHYKPTKEEREQRKKEREKAAKKKAKGEAELSKALAKVKWPLSEKQLDVLLNLILLRNGTSVTTPIAKRHGIEPLIKESYGRKYKDYETPLRKLITNSKPQAKAAFVFELLFEFWPDAGRKELKKL